jgi:MFS family permease
MISGFLQFWNLIIAVGAAFSVDRVGRRKLFLASCFGMLTSYIVISGLSGSFANTQAASTGIAVIPFLFLFYGFYDIAFTPLLISYTCEIWPFTYRAKGISMALMTTQLAVFFNIFVNPIALEAIQWKYYLVYVGILIGITATIWFFYPETNGHSLEEMARIFDGDNADVIAEGAAEEIVEKRMSVTAQGQVGEKGVASEDMRHIEEA